MADIIIDTYKLNQYAQRLANVNARISRLDRRLDSLYWRVGLLDLWNLMQADILTGYSWRLTRCQTYLQQTASDFDTIERALINQDPTNFNPSVTVVKFETVRPRNGYWNPQRVIKQRIIRNTLPVSVIGFGAVTSALDLMTSNGWNAFWAGDLKDSSENSEWSKSSIDGKSYLKTLTTEESVSLKPSYGKYKDKSILGDKNHLNIQKKQEKKDFKQINKDEQWYKAKGTVLEAKAERKVEGSVFSGHAEGDAKYAQGSAGIDLLTGEAHAEASAGLYVYTKGKNGETKKILSPSVSAEVGASVAVLQVEAEGRIGLGEDNNMLGLYGDVSAEALSAEAKGKVSFNSKEVYMGASAEANLAKVTATGGVAVLGTDIGVTGSLKVGVGAHAEVGYTDGKFKVDIGAAVGVGFDLGFEVDVSGTVDAVCDVATSAWEDTKDLWNGATDTISDVWNSIF